MSGDVASAQNTFGLLQWLLSRFVVLKPAQIGMVNFYLRKTGHAVSYGLMYFLWFRAFRGHLGTTPGRAFLSALGLCLLVALTDEGHQAFTETREGSGYDILLDLSGSMVTAMITFAVWSPRSKADAQAAVTKPPGAGTG